MSLDIRLIDWLVFNANFSSISEISWYVDGNVSPKKKNTTNI